MLVPERVLRRVTANVTVDGDCLISTYSTGSHGYAQVGWVEKGHRTMALCHRVIWCALKGPIPDGWTVDHTCKNRRCVNIEHLRVLTNYENARRTSGRDWPLGQCINGHDNSELHQEPSGRIRCRPCKRARQNALPRKK